jgi:hypothetical protein
MAELGAAASALGIASLVIQVVEHLQTQVILRGCELLLVIGIRSLTTNFPD